MRKLVTEDDIAWVDAWAVDMRRLIAERGHSGPPRPVSFGDIKRKVEGNVLTWEVARCPVCNGFGYDASIGEKCPCRGPHDGGVVWRVNALNAAKIPAKCIERTSRDLFPNTTRWIELWTPGSRGIAFISDVGTGKSHYMAAMTLAFVERGVRARMVFWPSFIADRKAAMGNQIRLDAQMDVFDSAPVLCIDELARERTTDWTSELLDEVIEKRYQNGKTTIVATNCRPDQFEEYVGPRLHSRLSSMCKLVEFIGLDRRKEQRA